MPISVPLQKTLRQLTAQQPNVIEAIIGGKFGERYTLYLNEHLSQVHNANDLGQVHKDLVQDANKAFLESLQPLHDLPFKQKLELMLVLVNYSYSGHIDRLVEILLTARLSEGFKAFNQADESLLKAAMVAQAMKAGFMHELVTKGADDDSHQSIVNPNMLLDRITHFPATLIAHIKKIAASAHQPAATVLFDFVVYPIISLVMPNIVEHFKLSRTPKFNNQFLGALASEGEIAEKTYDKYEQQHSYPHFITQLSACTLEAYDIRSADHSVYPTPAANQDIPTLPPRAYDKTTLGEPEKQNMYLRIGIYCATFTSINATAKRISANFNYESVSGLIGYLDNLKSFFMLQDYTITGANSIFAAIMAQIKDALPFGLGQGKVNSSKLSREHLALLNAFQATCTSVLSELATLQAQMHQLQEVHITTVDEAVATFEQEYQTALAEIASKPKTPTFTGIASRVKRAGSRLGPSAVKPSQSQQASHQSEVTTENKNTQKILGKLGNGENLEIRIEGLAEDSPTRIMLRREVGQAVNAYKRIYATRSEQTTYEQSLKFCQKLQEVLTTLNQKLTEQGLSLDQINSHLKRIHPKLHTPLQKTIAKLSKLTTGKQTELDKSSSGSDDSDDEKANKQQSPTATPPSRRAPSPQIERPWRSPSHSRREPQPSLTAAPPNRPPPEPPASRQQSQQTLANVAPHAQQWSSPVDAPFHSLAALEANIEMLLRQIPEPSDYDGQTGLDALDQQGQYVVHHAKLSQQKTFEQAIAYCQHIVDNFQAIKGNSFEDPLATAAEEVLQELTEMQESVNSSQRMQTQM